MANNGKFLAIFFVLAFSATVFAQSCQNAWTKTYGGPTKDWAESVQQTLDNGYIITGRTTTTDPIYGDMWLIKTDQSGNMDWNKTYGGANYDIGNKVQQTTDAGYIIFGITGLSVDANGDMWILKTNSSGNMDWNKTYGGIYHDSGNSGQQTSDGGYIIVGEMRSSPGAVAGDVWLIKTNSSGNMDWNKTYGGPSSDIGFDVQQTTDGGYIIVGTTESFGAGSSDVWLIKTNSSGNMDWNKTYGINAVDIGNSVKQTSDQGYIIAGSTGNNGWLIKTDSSGNMDWNKTYGASISGVSQTLDNGYIITGSAFTGTNLLDALLIKTNSSGNMDWNKTYGGIFNDDGRSVQQTSDGGFIIAGSTESFGSGSNGLPDVWLIKTDQWGNSPPNCPVCGNSITEAPETCDDTTNTDRPFPDTLNDGACVIDSTNTPASCKNNACGDGYLNSATEQCDDGVSTDIRFDPNNDGACVIDLANPLLSCRTHVCGDGYLDQDDGEQCDDGGTANGDGCNATCQFEAGAGQGQNILEVKITKITNQNNEQTDTFSGNETANVEVKVINYFGALSPTLTLVVKAVEGGISYPVLPTPEAVSFIGSGTITKNYSFVWAGKPNGTYEITASVPPQAGEKNFVQDNSDNKFISLVQKKANPVAVPETNLLLAPLAAFAAVALIYFSSRKITG